MKTPPRPPTPPSQKAMLRSLVLGGVLPVVAFTVIEEKWGTLAGVVAGMVFGVGEIFWEWRTQGCVDALTWGGNGLILVLGGVSFFTGEGTWFKLQPSILEAIFALVLWASCWNGSSLLVMMAQKQGQILPPVVAAAMRGLSVRLGVFFAFHAALAAWAAVAWSTTAWGVLKGVGFTVSLAVYMVVETLLLRYRIAHHVERKSPDPSPRFTQPSFFGSSSGKVLYQDLRMPNERSGHGANERTSGGKGDDPS